jgi:hypothetical protein
MIYATFSYKKIEITGQDTIAIAMTWMIKFVDENQEVLNELKVCDFFSILLLISLFFQYIFLVFTFKCCGFVI